MISLSSVMLRRGVLALAASGPLYQCGSSFGKRAGAPTHRRRRPFTPLVSLDQAKSMIEAGLAKCATTGRPDRSECLMLHLSDYGRAVALALRGPKAEAA